MLKFLLAATLLLQTAPPVKPPAQPVTKAGSSADKPIVVTPIIQLPPEDKSPRQIDVRQIPPISTTKDFFDKIYWVFGLLLVIATGFQTYLLFKTKDIINRQADLMASQTGLLTDSVAAAKTSADASVKSVEMFLTKERARLRVEVKLLDLTAPALVTGKRVVKVDFSIHHFGATAADIIETGISSFLYPSEKTVNRTYQIGMINIPPIIKPSAATLDSFTLVFAVISDEEIEAINKGKQFVHLNGHLKYKDVFDQVHETRFRYIWKSVEYPLAGFIGSWTKTGDPEENIET